MREAPAVKATAGLRILVPTDFSPCSDAALGCAKRLAAKLGGTVRLLHVMEHTVVRASISPDMFVPEPPEVHAEVVKEARSRLSRRILVDSRSRVPVTSDIVYGPTSPMITAYAADNGFDLIVMGTRGRSGLAHLVMGSITESVIRTARCPVLSVRSHAADHARVAEPAAALVAV
jgi:universal stress protein A